MEELTYSEHLEDLISQKYNEDLYKIIFSPVEQGMMKQISARIFYTMLKKNKELRNDLIKNQIFLPLCDLFIKEHYFKYSTDLLSCITILTTEIDSCIGKTLKEKEFPNALKILL